MYKFNASFRKSVAAVATELGMKFISTKRQVENGTLMFEDPETDSVYALYESGYIRRFIPLGWHWGVAQTIKKRNYAMYQLNKVQFAEKTTEYAGKTYTHTMKQRIKANPEEQLGIFVKSVVNYRNK